MGSRFKIGDMVYVASTDEVLGPFPVVNTGLDSFQVDLPYPHGQWCNSAITHKTFAEAKAAIVSRINDEIDELVEKRKRVEAMQEGRA